MTQYQRSRREFKTFRLFKGLQSRKKFIQLKIKKITPISIPKPIRILFKFTWITWNQTNNCRNPGSLSWHIINAMSIKCCKREKRNKTNPTTFESRIEKQSKKFYFQISKFFQKKQVWMYILITILILWFYLGWTR